MAPRTGLTIAAGSAAVMLLGAPSFTAPNAPSNSRAPARNVRGSAAPLEQQQPQGSFSGVAGVASVSAACALALGAVMARDGRAVGRTATRVVVKDDAGRFRFDVPMKMIVPSEQPGVTRPLGFFDPLGFTKNPLMTFPKDPNGFKHLRAAEIKHGRVAMMASIGSVLAHYVQFPGCEGTPTGIAALSTEQGGQGFAILFCLVGLFEASSWKQTSDEPGSYGDPFGFGQFTPEMRTKELNNGRMAMFAMIGQLAAELQTGLDPVQQFGL
jgi:light-harvesting complex I chlorophyll a/b binding protein 1